MLDQIDSATVKIFDGRDEFLSSSLKYRDGLNRLLRDEERDRYVSCKGRIMHEDCLNCIHFGILLRFNDKSKVL